MPFGPHLKRIEGKNHARFITCSCFHRRLFLDRDRTRRWLVEAIDRARTLHAFDLWAWVVMPEHFHLLIYPKPAGPAMGEILSSIKQSVTKRSLHWVTEHSPASLHLFADQRPDGRIIHRFWQRGGGYDRNLWTADEIWEKIDYIHENPVKRGLCKKPTEWQWSSAITYTDRQLGLLRIDDARIPRGMV